MQSKTEARASKARSELVIHRNDRYSFLEDYSYMPIDGISAFVGVFDLEEAG